MDQQFFFSSLLTKYLTTVPFCCLENIFPFLIPSQFAKWYHTALVDVPGSSRPATDAAPELNQPRFCLHHAPVAMQKENYCHRGSEFSSISVLSSAPKPEPEILQSPHNSCCCLVHALCFGPLCTALCVRSVSLQPHGIIANQRFSAWMLTEAIPNILSINSTANILAEDKLVLVSHLFIQGCAVGNKTPKLIFPSLPPVQY